MSAQKKMSSSSSSEGKMAHHRVVSLAPGSVPVFKQGWLTKQGGSTGGFMSRYNWRRRWFVLDATGISYYKDKKKYLEGAHLGHLKMHKDLVVEQCTNASSKDLKENMFQIRSTRKKPMLVKAETLQMKESWIDAMSYINNVNATRTARKEQEQSDGGEDTDDDDRDSGDEEQTNKLASLFEGCDLNSAEAALQDFKHTMQDGERSFANDMRHQLRLVDNQVGDGITCVEGFVAYLSEVIAVYKKMVGDVALTTSNHAKNLVRSNAKDQTNSGFLTTSAMNMCQAFNERLSNFVHNVKEKVVEPLDTWALTARSRRDDLNAREAKQVALITQKRKAMTKERKICLNYWEDLSKAYCDSLRIKSGEDVADRTKELKKLEEKVEVYRGKAYKHFGRFEALTKDLLLLQNQYVQNSVPVILATFQRVETGRIEEMRNRLSILAKLQSNLLMPIVETGALESNLKQCDTHKLIEECIQRWIAIYGDCPTFTPTVAVLPCSANALSKSVEIVPRGETAQMTSNPMADARSNNKDAVEVVPEGEEMLEQTNAAAASTTATQAEGNEAKVTSADTENGGANVTPAAVETEGKEAEGPRPIAVSDFTDSASMKVDTSSSTSTTASSAASSGSISASSSVKSVSSPREGKLSMGGSLSKFTSLVPAHVPEWVSAPAMQDVIYESLRGGGDDDDDDERDDRDDSSHKSLNPFNLLNKIRGMVSQKKRRFIEDGFDLDLSFILPNLIAMGFPAEGVAGKYRNNMGDVQRFLNQRCPRRYRIYNLCSEIGYDHSKFENRVARFGFPDHNPSPFDMIHDITRDMSKWLGKHEKNLCAVHCKAGKGRTGYVIAAFLLQCGKVETAKEALEFFAAKRTYDGQGVTIPSQKRFVCYYERWLKSELVREGKEEQKNLTYLPLEEIYDAKAVPRPLMLVPSEQRVVLRSVVLRGIPYLVNAGDPFWFEIKEAQKQHAFYSTSSIQPEYRLAEDYVLWTGRSNTGMTKCSGDIRFTFFTSTMKDKRHDVFHCWLNTRFFVAEEKDPTMFVVRLPKMFIDHARKDKRNKKYPELMGLEFHFQLAVNASNDNEQVSMVSSVPGSAAAPELNVGLAAFSMGSTPQVTNSLTPSSLDMRMPNQSVMVEPHSFVSQVRVADNSDDDDIDEAELEVAKGPSAFVKAKSQFQ